MEKTILGIFSKRDMAEKAISDLKDMDYNPKDISILMKDVAETKIISEDIGIGNVAQSTAKGAGTGAIIGGIAGLLAGTVIPGLGGFLIGGPIGAALGLTGAAATTISGAATGTVAGGIIGALVSTFGLSKDEAKIYEARIKAGGILVAVPVRSDEEEEVYLTLDQHGADNVRVIDNSNNRREGKQRIERGGRTSYGQTY